MKKKLGELCQVVSGTTPKTGIPEYWGGSAKWITPAELDDDSYIVEDSARKITELGIRKTGLSPFPAGTVLLTSRAPIGKVAIAGCEMYCNQGFKNLVCSERIHNKFLYWFLKSKTAYLNSLGRGATFKEISKAIVEQIEIEVPSLEKQKAVAMVLETIRHILLLRRAQLAALDELVKARFVEMFGDPVGNPMGWPTKPLGALGELERGRSKHRPRNDPKLLGGPYPLIQTGEVASAGLYLTTFQNTYSELGLQQSRMWKAGTLCITIAANIAQTAILGFDACFPDSVVGFIPGSETDAVFMHYWFSFFQKILEEQAPQVAQKNINLKILAELQVIVPATQKRAVFSAFVARTEKLKATIQRSLAETQRLFDSQLQEHFG